MKLDSDHGRSPIVCTRASSTGFILKRRFEGAQDEQLIQMSPPKRKRSGRETRNRSLNDLVDLPVLDVTGSDRNLEGLTTTVFHDLPIEPHNKMKHVESKDEASHLSKSGSEDVAKDPPKNNPGNPLLEKENPKILFVVVVVF